MQDTPPLGYRGGEEASEVARRRADGEVHETGFYQTREWSTREGQVGSEVVNRGVLSFL